ncbi:MAG: hypothetical protein JXB49_25425 [Bacteroidales bacterium]|nr:hypothetical protein [Bacteroidales bacterium]
MGQIIFIAAKKDTSSIYSTCIIADTVEELREKLITSIDEADRIFGERWYIEFDDVELDDLLIDEEMLDEIFDECLSRVEAKKVDK